MDRSQALGNISPLRVASPGGVRLRSPLRDVDGGTDTVLQIQPSRSQTPDSSNGLIIEDYYGHDYEAEESFEESLLRGIGIGYSAIDLQSIATEDEIVQSLRGTSRGTSRVSSPAFKSTASPSTTTGAATGLGSLGLDSGDELSDIGEGHRAGGGESGSVWDMMKKELRGVRKMVTCPWTPGGYLRFLTVLAMIGLVGLLFYFFMHPEWVNDFFTWIKDLGKIGEAVCIIFLIITQLPMAYGYVVVAMMCGLLYGLAWGFIFVVIATLIGLPAAFYLTDKLMRKYIEAKVAKSLRLRALLFTAKKNGFKISILVRLMPVPVGLISGLLCVADINFTHFYIGSLIGLLPEMFFYVLIGSSAKDALELTSGETKMTTEQKIFFALAGISGVVFGVVVLYYGRKAVNQAMKEMEEEEEARRQKELEEQALRDVHDEQSVGDELGVELPEIVVSKIPTVHSYDELPAYTESAQLRLSGSAIEMRGVRSSPDVAGMNDASK